MGYNCGIMLKCLAILGLLLAVSQALAPIPRQATTRPGNGGGNANGDSQSKNAVPAPPVPVVDPSQSPVNAKHASEVGAEETKHSVTLTSVPPLTINDKKKSFWDHVYDWGPWFFGLFLAVAGGVQLRLLRVTWKAIQEQKTEMSIQTGILKDSVAVAQKSADAAGLSAKAAMGVSVPLLALYRFSFDTKGREHPVTFYHDPHVQLELKNYGQSPAFLKKFNLNFSWGTEESSNTGYDFEAEQVIDAGGIFAFKERELGILTRPPAEVIGYLVAGSEKLVFSGWVTYKDVFGSPAKKLEFGKHLIEFDSEPDKMLTIDDSLLRNPFADPDDD
jgi:hypothetical protein